LEIRVYRYGTGGSTQTIVLLPCSGGDAVGRIGYSVAHLLVGRVTSAATLAK
jgi:hypothetical protein